MGGVLLAVGETPEGGCIQQLRFQAQQGPGGGRESTQCNEDVLDFDGGRRYMEEVDTAAAAAAIECEQR